jgi:hypothetical protein
MTERLLHGLIQKALIDANTLPYVSYNGGKGKRIWRKSVMGWNCIGELSSDQDAEDFLVGKLTQEDR